MPRPGRRALSALITVLAALGALLVLPQPAAAAPVQVQILTVNDFHGRLEPPDETDDEPPLPIGGAAQLGGLVDQLRGNGPTSFVAAGDLIGASTFVSAIDDDNPTIDAFNEMGLDASSVGNHEFDKGIDDLTGRVEPRADFPYLGANVYRDGTRALDAYTVIDVGGIDVGYVGTVTEQTASLVTPGGIVGVEFRDPVAETEAVAAELKDGNPQNGEADIVVALTHEGAGPESIGSAAALAADPVFGEFTAMSADVDAIVSGHTHQPYAFMVPGPGGVERPVVQAEDYGQVLGRITLTVDDATGTVSAGTAELIPVVGYPADPAVQAIVDAAVANAAVLGAEPVGSITADIVRGGTPPGSDRGVQSVLGNFIADVQLAGTEDPGRGDADIAFMNSGGLRDDLLVEGDGVITYSEAFDVQSFANDVFTKTFTGAQIKDVLEQQWQPAGASRPVLWLGVSEGFSYTYNPGAPRGFKVNADSLLLDGTPIDPGATYRVTMNGFLETGGDNFFTLGEGTDRVTTGDLDLTMLTDYLEANSPVTADVEPRNTVAVPTDPDLTPFASTQAAVSQQFADFAGRAPTPEEQQAWEVGIYQGNRTLEQLVLELQTVELQTNTATMNRIYLALFQRPADAAGLAYWVDQLEGGRGLIGVATYFTKSPEFQRLYGSLDDGAFVDLLYQNVLGRAPSDVDRAYWVDQLTRRGRPFVFVFFANSAENRARTATQLKVIDLSTRMLGRPPSKGEMGAITASFQDGTLTLTALVDLILHAPEYDARINPEA